jgi:hypothetical protein
VLSGRGWEKGDDGSIHAAEPQIIVERRFGSLCFGLAGSRRLCKAVERTDNRQVGWIGGLA